jgi:hypothetical protein
MNDDALQEVLNRADERFRTSAQSDPTAFVAAVHRRRLLRLRRRRLGAVAVLLLAGGLSAWSLNIGLRGGPDPQRNSIASITANQPSITSGKLTNESPPARAPLSDDEINRLKAEIAALDAEANRVRQYVELYRAAESRRERLAAATAVDVEPLLPPQVVADLEVDRAAAITVLSADLQANAFQRRDEASDAYRSVLKHFPNSRWAHIAEQRLAQVQHMN